MHLATTQPLVSAADHDCVRLWQSSLPHSTTLQPALDQNKEWNILELFNVIHLIGSVSQWISQESIYLKDHSLPLSFASDPNPKLSVTILDRSLFCKLSVMGFVLGESRVFFLSARKFPRKGRVVSNHQSLFRCIYLMPSTYLAIWSDLVSRWWNCDPWKEG